MIGRDNYYYSNHIISEIAMMEDEGTVIYLSRNT